MEDKYIEREETGPSPQEVPGLQTAVARMAPGGCFQCLRCSCALLQAFAVGHYQRQNNGLEESLV